jgi:hypothetical protein
MTTGRINQVTVLRREGRGPQAWPPEGDQELLLTGGDAPRGERHLDRRVPRSGARGGPNGHPFAPTMFPKGRSTAQRFGARRRREV